MTSAFVDFAVHSSFADFAGETDVEEKDPVDNIAEDEPNGENSNSTNVDDYDDENEGDSTDGEDDDEEESDLEEQVVDENENCAMRVNHTAALESESENETENQDETSISRDETTDLDGKWFCVAATIFY